MSQFSSQSAVRREVFHMPTEVGTALSDAFFSGRSPGSASFLLQHSLTEAADPTDGMMMTTRHTEAGAMVTRQITRGVVQRSVTGAASVTRKMTYES